VCRRVTRQIDPAHKTVKPHVRLQRVMCDARSDRRWLQSVRDVITTAFSNVPDLTSKAASLPSAKPPSRICRWLWSVIPRSRPPHAPVWPKESPPVVATPLAYSPAGGKPPLGSTAGLDVAPRYPSYAPSRGKIRVSLCVRAVPRRPTVMDSSLPSSNRARGKDKNSTGDNSDLHTSIHTRNLL
jgi:hypothetical protein